MRQLSLLSCHYPYILIILITPILSSWIDPDTPSTNRTLFPYFTTTSLHLSNPYNHSFSLVFSDEFNTDNRNFGDGYDPKWTAIHKNDYTNFALHYYNRDLVSTSNGYLNISTIIRDISFTAKDFDTASEQVVTKKITKNYQSGMIQGWNKFCFTGGIIEVRARLPGKGDIGGFWPAIWLLGNLARATYVSSSNNVWPWSYDTCSKDLQSQQLFSACNSVNHFHLNPFQGRGAPEIDILEVMPGREDLINTPVNKPYLSTSLQIAPALQSYRPVDASVPALDLWYNHGLDYGLNASLNIFFYGMFLRGMTSDKSYLADALSANTNIDNSFFNDFHDYRIEWQPGDEGYIRWYIDGIFRYGIDSNALNITGSKIPSEPMYLILNNAISSKWGFPIPCPVGCPCDCFDARNDECLCAIPSKMIENFPAYFLIDYIRVYQDPLDSSHTIGCSTKEFLTKKYIEAHPHFYVETENMKAVPLLPITAGGLSCDFGGDDEKPMTTPGSNQCGFGTCSSHGKCECFKGYTGPNCKVAESFNDIDLDPETEVLSLSSFLVPSSLLVLSVVVCMIYFVIGLYKYKDNITKRGSWRLFKRSYFGVEWILQGLWFVLSCGTFRRGVTDEYEGIELSDEGHRQGPRQYRRGTQYAPLEG